jgi:deoxyxylulose-5-phosphate synthase
VLKCPRRRYFVNEVERLATPDHNLVALEPAMRDAAALAANSYKMASNRRELSAAADFAVVLRAIAQQTWKTEVHSGPHSLAKYGMLVDRAASLVIAQADMRIYEQLDDPKVRRQGPFPSPGLSRCTL